jgi:hypothetical protein
MKLKFSIHYHTAWGESLHVCIDFHSQDGTMRHQNLLMQTEDGELWTLETSALMSRQHPLSHIQYRYQVEDAHEQVLRKEWDMVPRIYFFDATKDYIFPDEWRDRPLPMHLYSQAYLTTQHSPRTIHLSPLRLPAISPSHSSSCITIPASANRPNSGAKAIRTVPCPSAASSPSPSKSVAELVYRLRFTVNCDSAKTVPRQW